MVVPPPLILASGSPRRRALLARLGLAFAVRPSDADESFPSGTPPAALVAALAERKARAVAAETPTGLVLGADTAVILGGEVLGKPADAADNLAMLQRLRGRAHEVWTGLALLDAATGRAETAAVRSIVRFGAPDDATLAAYVATGEGRDKAGGYAIQGGAAVFAAIDGCVANVVGLPLCEVAALLARLGLAPNASGPVCVDPAGAPCPRLLGEPSRPGVGTGDAATGNHGRPSNDAQP